MADLAVISGYGERLAGWGCETTRPSEMVQVGNFIPYVPLELIDDTVVVCRRLKQAFVEHELRERSKVAALLRSVMACAHQHTCKNASTLSCWQVYRFDFCALSSSGTFARDLNLGDFDSPSAANQQLLIG